MARKSFRVVRLIRSRQYPTYQLYATMANTKTVPHDGLKIAALTAMAWLRDRLGEEAPPAFRDADPERYLEADNQSFPSLRISHGFVIDIVSLPEKGIWSLQITEPDLGSEPGNPDQERPAVPGRVIETNVGFRVFGQQLECAFQTVISDPATVETPCEVYRLAIVKKLMRNPNFRLRQVARLEEVPAPVETGDQFKRLVELVKSPENQLPILLFTNAEKDISLPAQPVGLGTLPYPSSLPMPAKAPREPFLPYDAEDFARETTGFARVVTGDLSALGKTLGALGVKALPGDAVVFHPAFTGNDPEVFPYKPSKQRQEETLAALRALVLSYPRGREISFGHVLFLAEARKALVTTVEDAKDQLQRSDAAHEEASSGLKEDLKRLAEDKDQEIQALREQVARLKEYQAQLDREKSDVLSQLECQRKDFERQLHEEDEYVEFLERKLDAPTDHAGIAGWVARHFSDRLLLHPKALDLLQQKSAQEIDLGLICDALDFLATDYWENRYRRVPEEVMMTRCSKKYHRPFEIKPTGNMTVQYTPADYKIKYGIGAKGKPVESALDYHLGVGNSPDSLLRIYFLHDDEKKLIVVGSLPHHLRAVTIR